jgi:hypothetical protein
MRPSRLLIQAQNGDMDPNESWDLYDEEGPSEDLYDLLARGEF